MPDIQSLSFAFSPCPNDTFIFAAMVKGYLGHGAISPPALLDIEELNQVAGRRTHDVVKVSVAAYPQFAEDYQILPSGAALGLNVGPLLVRAKTAPPSPPEGAAILIPGERTTANLLLKEFYPHIAGRTPTLFSEIIPAIQTGKCQYGLLIHEGRFTYQSSGLELVADLGKLWTERYGLPIPLGVICARRDLPEGLKQQLAQRIRESIRYARAHLEEVRDYVAQHAQELSPEVQAQHIELYVNDFSLDLGPTGRRAIERLLHVAGFAGEGYIL